MELKVVLVRGLEPPTFALRMHCTTIVLHQQTTDSRIKSLNIWQLYLSLYFTYQLSEQTPVSFERGLFGQSLINHKNATTRTKIVTKSGIKFVSSIHWLYDSLQAINPSIVPIMIQTNGLSNVFLRVLWIAFEIFIFITLLRGLAFPI